MTYRRSLPQSAMPPSDPLLFRLIPAPPAARYTFVRCGCASRQESVAPAKEFRLCHRGTSTSRSSSLVKT